MNREIHLALAAAFLLASSAHAGLIGTTLTANYLYPDASTVYSTDIITVDSSVEIQCTGFGVGNANMCAALFAPDQSVDFQDGAIAYTYSGTGTGFNPNLVFNGFEFLNLNPGVPILAVSLSTNIQGLDLSRISFTESSIRVNMVDLQMAASRYFTLSFETSTPEPGSIALLLGGLAALLPAIRRRRI